MNLGKRMRLIRVDNGLTQSELAEMMRVKQSYISQLELNKLKPTRMYISLFCLRFKISEENLLKGEKIVCG